VRGSNPAVISTTFINGNPDGTNHAYSQNVTIPFVGVGPILSVGTASGTTSTAVDSGSTVDFGSISSTHANVRELIISNTGEIGFDQSLTGLTIKPVLGGTDANLFQLLGPSDSTTGQTEIDAGGSPFYLRINYLGTGSPGYDATATLDIYSDVGAPFGTIDTTQDPTWTCTITAQLTGAAPAITSLPEPSSLVLLAVAGLFFGGLTWRRRAIKTGYPKKLQAADKARIEADDAGVIWQ
jgi:hypothetical protein